MTKKRFKKGDRVYREGRGFGTVTMDTYSTMNYGYFGTKTAVKWDDYLGQKFALAEESEKLELVEEEPEGNIFRPKFYTEHKDEFENGLKVCMYCKKFIKNERRFDHNQWIDMCACFDCY